MPFLFLNVIPENFIVIVLLKFVYVDCSYYTDTRSVNLNLKRKESVYKQPIEDRYIQQAQSHNR